MSRVPWVCRMSWSRIRAIWRSLLTYGGHQDHYLRRLVRLGAGLVLFGVSIAVMLTAGLGVDSWDVLDEGVAERTGITFGWVVNGVSLSVLLLWIPLRERPWLGSAVEVALLLLVVRQAWAWLRRTD